MKTKQLFLPVLTSAIALLAKTAPAQTWQTVDTFQYVAGQPAYNYSVTVASAGVIYACGFGLDGTLTHGLVMASADHGNTWSAPLDDFVYPGSENGARHESIVSDPFGNLYVQGRDGLTNGPVRQFVRRSTDAGASWQTVVDLPSSYGKLWTYQGLAADAAGNIYLLEDPSSGSQWAVAKGIGGTNYSIVDNPSGIAYAVFVHPTAGVFAAGYIGSLWTVRRSLDGGTTWTTVDSYQASSGYDAQAFGLGADAHGNLYAVGGVAMPYTKKTSVTHWQVRKSTNAGASWSTVDDYVFSTSYQSWPRGFTADASGNLYVVGLANSSTPGAPAYWLARENQGGNGAWTTVDAIQSNGANTITADSLGNVFVGGSTGTTNVSWAVRGN